MMRVAFSVWSAVVLAATSVVADKNGGSACAACVLIVNVIEQASMQDSQGIAHWLSEKGCHLLPKKAQPACHDIVEGLGPAVIIAIESGLTPDEVCDTLSLCTSKSCALFPKKQREAGALDAIRARVVDAMPVALTVTGPAVMRDALARVGNFDKFNLWNFTEYEIKRLTEDHLPIFDLDGDNHPDGFKGFRGSAWRGRDCNERRSDVYPGHSVVNADRFEDSDCNGIAGVNPETEQPYEDELCKGTDARGVVVLGDSAGAHFRLPPQWLQGDQYTSNTFDHFFEVVENELDFPHQSWGTGHVETGGEQCPGPVESLYKHFYQNNRCAHRDYENNGVNGAKMRDANNTLIPTSMSRQQTDKPIQVFLSMFGNDVCNHVADRMTTPEDFRAYALGSLAQLDAKLPAGSNVLLTGLADGRVLYDNLSQRPHPVGRGVKYADVYRFLNCLDISPCAGWMNDDEAVRNRTYARKEELNAVLESIATDNKTDYSFGLAFYNVDFNEAAKRAKKELWQLIEPTDGFHPNQYGMATIAGMIWDFLQHNTTFVPPENPNNDKIQALFGEQGGY